MLRRLDKKGKRRSAASEGPMASHSAFSTTRKPAGATLIVKISSRINSPVDFSSMLVAIKLHLNHIKVIEAENWRKDALASSP